jgi:ABC-2 type transport system ATP-binding protein
VREHRHTTAEVGYLSQRFSLYGDLTVDENIAFFAEVHGVDGYAARRDQLLDMMQLTPFRKRLASKLSGGMKQKLALACTLVHQPRLLLLDEPTTGVDPVSRREFWKLLSEFLSQGITILLSTPYLDEAERCAQVALLHEGRVLAVDTPSAIRARVPGQVVEVTALPHSQKLEADTIGLLPHVLDAQVFGDRLHVTLTSDDDDVLSRFSGAVNQLPHVHAAVRSVPPSLEDAFISILSREEVSA